MMWGKFMRYFLSCFLLSGILTVAPVAAQTDTLTTAAGQQVPDTLLFKIQQAQSLITEITALNSKTYGLSRIKTGLEEISSNLIPIEADLKMPDQVTDSKTLANFSLILNNAREQLTGWQTSLTTSANELQRSMNRIVSLSSDSLLVVSAGDSSGKQFYRNQLTALRLQLQEAGTITTVKLDTISIVLASVSEQSLLVSNLQTAITRRLRSISANALQKESPYLWEAPASISRNGMADIARTTFLGQNKILRYFFASTWDNRVLLLLLSVGFFFWVFTNYKKAARHDIKTQIGEINFTYLKPLLVLASLIVLFNLTPLFEPSAPALYVELTQFALLLCLTVYFWRRLSKVDMQLWGMNAVLYVLLLVTDALVNDSLLMRLWMMALNIGFIYIGIRLYRKLQGAKLSERFIRPVNIAYLVLQVLAIVLNIFGRISLAKSFGVTAVIGLTQIIGLAVFVQIVLEALELQIRVSSCTGGLFSRVNLPHTRRSARWLLSGIAVIIWLIVFLINLGIADATYNFFYGIITRPRSFGSVTFTLGNILFFFLILYIAAKLQNNIGLLFGESQLVVVGQQKTQQRSSKLSLARLIIVVVGVLLAITASGITLTRLTIVLGALTVGIGLGLQMIVSNFVSGIILLFEKPFQIGDYVEIGDKKGKIQDIGIRSSKMLTVVGSEIIIPNSDFLSNRLVNWTSNNDYLKSELLLKVAIDTDMEAVTKIVREEAAKGENVLKNLPAEVLVNAISADSMELKISVWISNIYAEAAFKSGLLLRLVGRFKAAEIKVM